MKNYILIFLSIFLFNGCVTSNYKDNKKSFKRYKTNCNNSEKGMDYCFQVARDYENGSDFYSVTMNIEKSKKFYRRTLELATKTCMAGNSKIGIFYKATPCDLAGQLYHDGAPGIKKDIEKSRFYYEKAIAIHEKKWPDLEDFPCFGNCYDTSSHASILSNLYKSGVPGLEKDSMASEVWLRKHIYLRMEKGDMLSHITDFASHNHGLKTNRDKILLGLSKAACDKEKRCHKYNSFKKDFPHLNSEELSLDKIKQLLLDNDNRSY